MILGSTSQRHFDHGQGWVFSLNEIVVPAGTARAVWVFTMSYDILPTNSSMCRGKPAAYIGGAKRKGKLSGHALMLPCYGVYIGCLTRVLSGALYLIQRVVKISSKSHLLLSLGNTLGHASKSDVNGYKYP